jgi:hypothetical protein
MICEFQLNKNEILIINCSNNMIELLFHIDLDYTKKAIIYAQIFNML